MTVIASYYYERAYSKYFKSTIYIPLEITWLINVHEVRLDSENQKLAHEVTAIVFHEL